MVTTPKRILAQDWLYSGHCYSSKLKHKKVMASSTITIKRANTYSSGPLTFYTVDAQGVRTPYTPPVGAVFLFTVKRLNDDANDDSTAIITQDCTAGITLLESDTDKPEDTYRYDIKIIADGVRLNANSGTFVIESRETVRNA